MCGRWFWRAKYLSPIVRRLLSAVKFEGWKWCRWHRSSLVTCGSIHPHLSQSRFVLTWRQEHCLPSCCKTLDPEQTDASSKIQLLVGCADVLGWSLLGDCFLMKSACLMSSLLNSTVRSPLTHFYPTESQTPHIHSDARPSYTSKHLPKDRPMQIL